MALSQPTHLLHIHTDTLLYLWLHREYWHPANWLLNWRLTEKDLEMALSQPTHLLHIHTDTLLYLWLHSWYLKIFPGIDKVKDFLHTFDKDKANDEDKREWVAEGALRHQFFFNSRFRWTHKNTHPSEGFYFDEFNLVVPPVPHTVENTCVALEGTAFNTRPTVYDKCIIPSIDADYQINRNTDTLRIGS